MTRAEIDAATDEEVDRTAELVAVFGRGLVRMATVPA